MSGLANLNLIRFLDFYFTLMFLIGLYRRIGQYREVLRLALTGRGRWPKLLKLINEHRTIFMTWSTVSPGLLALLLMLVQLLASQQLWPQAKLTVRELADIWPALVITVPLGITMLIVDIYCAFQVGQLDREAMEKYFNEAEYWLRSHTAHVVRIFTFGYMNPRRMVDVEVRKALVDASKLLQTNFWWISIQVALRVTFGLALWGTWLVNASQ